jgi:hypothetical protein
MNQLSPFWMFAALAGSSACGADTAGVTRADGEISGPAPPDPGPGGGSAVPDGPRCDVAFAARDIPFVNIIFPVWDACPSRNGAPQQPSSTVLEVTRDELGQTCMQGELPGSGWATLIVGFDGSNVGGNTPVPAQFEPLDATAFGITGISFTLEPAPVSGVLVEMASTVGEDCFPMCQLNGGYYPMSQGAPGVLHSITEAGTYRFRFEDFEAAPWADPTVALDPSHLAGVFFELGVGPFDFCLRDFQLLDAGGEPVTPTGS